MKNQTKNFPEQNLKIVQIKVELDKKLLGMKDEDKRIWQEIYKDFLEGFTKNLAYEATFKSNKKDLQQENTADFSPVAHSEESIERLLKLKTKDLNTRYEAKSMVVKQIEKLIKKAQQDEKSESEAKKGKSNFSIQPQELDSSHLLLLNRLKNFIESDKKIFTQLQMAKAKQKEEASYLGRMFRRVARGVGHPQPIKLTPEIKTILENEKQKITKDQVTTQVVIGGLNAMEIRNTVTNTTAKTGLNQNRRSGGGRGGNGGSGGLSEAERFPKVPASTPKLNEAQPTSKTSQKTLKEPVPVM